MKISAATAKVLAIMAEGGVLEGMRLYPGPWAYTAVPKTGSTARPGDETITQLAMQGLITGAFEDRGQNTHAMRFTLSMAGYGALANYDALHPKKRSKAAG